MTVARALPKFMARAPRNSERDEWPLSQYQGACTRKYAGPNWFHPNLEYGPTVCPRASARRTPSSRIA